MKFLAVVSPRAGVGLAELAPLRRAEADYVWSHYVTGVVREFYHRTDKLGAVLILEIDDAQTGHRVLDGLPMLQAGLLTYELLSLAPFTLIADLFGDDAEAEA
ncbi:hypothetical protein EV647_0546 [Kribbella sp. VKM Ac-2566]|nr:hypothetical protein EV647_0546 [Kribbella sp. VKM Ac-2566]